ncbi:hypothetical protein L7F22_031594 [Adiantum nelumboides]|nr:hypothetical protein [Adiantum nelumboides]
MFLFRKLSRRSGLNPTGQDESNLSKQCEDKFSKQALDQASKLVCEGDYEEALWILEKLGQIDPSFKGVAELAAVADVCNAANLRTCGCPRENRNPDWYKVLKVDEKSELSAIKKRYRHLALLLHPDKNKHIKAEAAFKLVSEILVLSEFCCDSDVSFGLKCNRPVSSLVTIGGHVGRIFQLSKSVRQGCPLAPYLFLFVAEMMSDLIRAQQPALRGLLMPVADERDLIDQEYADDTFVFLHYSPDILDTIRDVLEVFCVASGARINWHKSYGILAGSDDIPTCGFGDFTWLGPGETCRYLRFQVGLDDTPEQ